MVKPSLLKLKCEACGADLHIELGADIVKCGHCATEYRVQKYNTGIGRPILLDDKIYYVETILDGDHYVGEKNPWRFWLWIAALALVLILALLYVVFGGC